MRQGGVEHPDYVSKGRGMCQDIDTNGLTQL